MKFPLHVILGVTTGRLLGDIGEMYSILNHITGDNLFTHVLPRAMRFARPLLIEDYPALKRADDALPDLDKALASASRDELLTICQAWVASLGLVPELDVKSNADAWLSLDPVEELTARIGREKVVALKPEASK